MEKGSYKLVNISILTMIHWVKHSGTQDVLSGLYSHLNVLKMKIHGFTWLFLYSVNIWEMTGRNPVFLLISVCISAGR